MGVFFRSGRDGILRSATPCMRLTSKAFKARLGDVHYAMRIGVQLVLEELGSETKSETGFGLWTRRRRRARAYVKEEDDKKACTLIF